MAKGIRGKIKSHTAPVSLMAHSNHMNRQTMSSDNLFNSGTLALWHYLLII